MTGASRLRAIAAWTIGVIAAAWIVGHARFTADLSAFLPARPTPEQQVLIEQLREGPASHLVLVAVDGGTSTVDAPTLAAVSRAMGGRLRADPHFLSVSNGQNATQDRDRAFLFDHRYLLSDRTTPERYTEAGLHDALSDTVDLLTSSAGLMLQSLIQRDPTAELVHLVEQLTAGHDLPSVDGAWVTHAANGDVHALIVAETRAPGSDIDGQQVAIDGVRKAFDAARAEVGGGAANARLVLSGPPVFAVDARNTIQHDAERLSAAGLTLVALLLGFVYRSGRALVLGLVPMATGALAGLAVVALVFGTIHGIALGFGVTLIGEAVDYAIYLFVQRPSGDADAPRSTRFWRTIALGVATSAIGFAALLLSGFEGLAQIGTLSIAGLVVAAAVTRWVLPALLPAGFAVRAMPAAGERVARAAATAPRLRWVALVIAVVSCGIVFAHRDALWNRELGSLSPMSQSVQDADERLRAELGAPDVRDIVVASAPDREAALVAGEAVVAVLAPRIERGELAGVEAPASYLPSQAVQRARQAALPDPTTLRARFAAALAGLPFAKGGFEGFFADVERQRTTPPLDDTALAGTSMGPGLRALLSSHDDGRRWTAIVALRSAPGVEAPRAGIAADLARLDAGGSARVRLIDIKDETQGIYTNYLGEAVRTAGIGALAIVALLGAALRDARRLARVVLPLAIAVVVVAAAHLAVGPLNLFHLVGLLLIVAVGSNYALFFDGRSSSGDDRAVLVSLVVANLTAVIGFGALALSSLPVLNAIGTTVAPGAFLALILSAIWARPRATVDA
jgi:predicted exporter